MRTFLKAGFVGLMLVLAAPAASQDSEKASEAYDRGDYATALREWRPLAEAGDDSAQFGLGYMYHFGQGVPQDYATSAKWYRLAAEQGDARAQNNLGSMYYAGQGVPQDYVQAHMWSNLAAAQGNADAAKNRDLAASKMTPADISKAQQLAKEWLEKHPQ